MIPIRFGSPSRQLAGFFHAPTGAARGESCVICNPFGQESIRSHRLVRLLAERLARSGVAVLRFDYFATGDSLGDDEEADFDGWCDDVLTAQRELKQRAGDGALSMIGLRLGAVVAATASAKSEGHYEQLRRLVLWDPVCDGAAYLGELSQSHADAMQMAYGIRYTIEKKLRALFAAEAENEALGFVLPPAFKSKIQQINAQSFSTLRAANVNVFCHDSAPLAGLLGQLSTSGISHQVTEVSAVSWAANEMMNSSVVPADILESIVNTFVAGS